MQQRPIPAYTQLRNDERLTQRMYDIMVSGVSVRKDDEALPEMAHTVCISKMQRLARVREGEQEEA